MLRKIDQLKPILLNYLICNDTTITDWYQDDDMFYAETSSRIIAAKKLTQNQYICYIASPDMKDFLLKGINTIRLDKENIGWGVHYNLKLMQNLFSTGMSKGN